MKRLIVLLLLIAAAAVAAEYNPALNPMSLEYKFQNSPSETSPQDATKVITIRNGVIRQLPYTSVSRYTLPVASTDTLGGIKVGTGLAVDGNGKLNNTGVSGVASFNSRGGAVKPGFNDYSASHIKGLATVAKTGSYFDLSNRPTIPAAQVSSDWNASSGVTQILNKPTIPTALSQLSQSPSYRTVTDTEKSAWNSNTSPVQSVFGRTGAIVAATGDYTADMVGADALGSATSVQDNLDTHTAAFASYTSVGGGRPTWSEADAVYLKPTSSGAGLSGVLKSDDTRVSASAQALSATPVILHPSPPTVTLSAAGAATSIASPVVIAKDAAVYRDIGIPLAAWTNNTGYMIPGGNLNSMPYSREFEFDGTVCEIQVIEFNGKYRLSVDGMPLTVDSQALTSSGQSKRIKLDFGTRGKRIIKVEGFLLPIGTVTIGPTDSVQLPPRTNKPVALFIGDSYTQTSSATPSNVWTQQVSRILGWDYYSDGYGGSGWNSTGSNVPSTRVSTDAPGNPDIVIFALGYNDAPGGNFAGIQTAFDAAIAQVQTSLPKAKIIIVGPWSPSGSPTANLTTVRDTLSAKAAAAGLPFVDTFGWITGTGTTGAPTGSGNADLYTSADGVHPNAAGHEYIGRRAAAGIAKVLKSSSASPLTTSGYKGSSPELALADHSHPITAIALANGTTATTQAAGDNSTKVATTAYADRKADKPGSSTANSIPTLSSAGALQNNALFTYTGGFLQNYISGGPAVIRARTTGGSVASFPTIATENWLDTSDASSYPVMLMGNYGGTSTTPAVTPTGKKLFQAQAKGHNGSAYVVGAMMTAVGDGAWSGSANGAKWEFFTTPSGSTAGSARVSIEGNGQIASTVATGTAPLAVASTTKVANLNVDYLDGYHASTAPTASTIPVTDANGNLPVKGIIETTYAPTGTTITVSLANGGIQRITTTAATTVNLPTLTAGQSLTLNICQGTTPYAVTWGGTVPEWQNGTAYVVDQVANKCSKIVLDNDGVETMAAGAGTF